jgi:hypothetical protein
MQCCRERLKKKIFFEIIHRKILLKFHFKKLIEYLTLNTIKELIFKNIRARMKFVVLNFKKKINSKILIIILFYSKF